jgi:hypothetical protein
MTTMHFSSFVDEFCKLAAQPVSVEEAEKSLKKLRSMEASRDMPAMARSAAVGAALTPFAFLASRGVAGTSKLVKPGATFNLRRPLQSLKSINWSGLGRQAAADAMMGSIASGVTPLAREAVERRAQEAKLKTFIEQTDGERKRGLSRVRRAIAEQTGV